MPFSLSNQLDDDVDIVITHDHDWFRLDVDLVHLFSDDHLEVKRVLQGALQRQFNVKQTWGTPKKY